MSAGAIAACGGWHPAARGTTEGDPLAGAAAAYHTGGGTPRKTVVVCAPSLGTFQASRVALDDIRKITRLIPSLPVEDV